MVESNYLKLVISVKPNEINKVWEMFKIITGVIIKRKWENNRQNNGELWTEFLSQ